MFAAVYYKYLVTFLNAHLIILVTSCLAIRSWAKCIVYQEVTSCVFCCGTVSVPFADFVCLAGNPAW